MFLLDSEKAIFQLCSLPEFFWHPISDLSFDMLLSPQARNITVCIEFKSSDEEGAKPLKVSC